MEKPTLPEILRQHSKTRSPRTLIYSCVPLGPIRSESDWRDLDKLGLSVVGCWAMWLPAELCFWSFTLDNGFENLQVLIDSADEIVGFNSLEFGDRLLERQGIRIETTFDLMQQVRKAAGQPMIGPCRRGYDLLHLAAENLGTEAPAVTLKHGTCPGHVPDLWRRGKKRKLIDYCLNDTILIGELYNRRRDLGDPRRFGVRLHCDDRLIDWNDVKASINYYLAERFLNIQLTSFEHWSGANLWAIWISIAETVTIRFPVWIKPEKDWREYVGLPFKKNLRPWLTVGDAYSIYLEAQANAERKKNDIDPLPF